MTASLSKDAARPAADAAAEAKRPSPAPTDPAAEAEARDPDSADIAAEAEGSDAAPALDPDIQRQLGTLLRGMYADLLGRPVPDRFADILRRLEARPKDDRS